MATTTNYGWAEPDNTSLVKNGAQDIRILGDAIDASVWNIGYGQAGKNKIINGDFDIWQRGTSFTVANATRTFTADRWAANRNGGGTFVVSQQAFTPGTAPVAGYEGEYFLRANQTVAGSGTSYHNIATPLEDVRIFAGQTATFSFWAKADSARVITPSIVQSFGSGGSGDVATVTSPTTATLTTSWARYSFTVTLPSVTGKTIGAGSSLIPVLSFPYNSTFTIDLWGVQLERGSTATPFQTASGGSPQAELAMCQRYYHRFNGNSTSDSLINSGLGFSTTIAMFVFNLGTTMRIAPSSMEVSNEGVYNVTTGLGYSGGTWALNQQFDNSVRVIYTHGSAVLTLGAAVITSSTNASNYFAFSAEL
jgi:hypothetical protein